MPAKFELERPHFKIEWRQLTYSVDTSLFKNIPMLRNNKHDHRNRKVILDSLHGHFRSGRLSAIMGPSGSGKSTLLSVLFGSHQDSAYGQTKVSWFADSDHQKPIDPEQRRAMKVAFLPQHDRLVDQLTVFESLMFASKLKNPHMKQTAYQSTVSVLDANGSSPGLLKNYSWVRSSNGSLRRRYHDPCSLIDGREDVFHERNVKKIASMLKLSNCLHTRCSKISGGQYKRVSIAQEFLSNPDIIILDEPTTGLDIVSCEDIIKTLRSVVRRQPISIIITIHQPDIEVFNRLQHVYVLAQGGRAIYEGPPSDIAPVLASVGIKMSADINPARVIVDLAFVSSRKSPGCQADEDGRVSLIAKHDDGHGLASTPSTMSMSTSTSTSTSTPTSTPSSRSSRSRRQKNTSRPDATSPTKQVDMDIDEDDDDVISMLIKIQESQYHERSAAGLRHNPANVDSPNSSPMTTATLSTSSSLSMDKEMEQHDMKVKQKSELDVDFRFDFDFEPIVNLPLPATARKFDKLLDSKRTISIAKRSAWRHMSLLTNRVWLSLIRDPIVVGVQLVMHTLIPITFGVIFGTHADNGCPNTGQFDLVEFAYSDSHHMTKSLMFTISEIRANIGIMAIGLFILCFGIAAITALIFPASVQILLKEHSNGWYSITSYFAGRCLAELPIPIVIHSASVGLMLFFTSQPFSPGQVAIMLALVILATIAAQSLGFIFGAIFASSYQSALLCVSAIMLMYLTLAGLIMPVSHYPYWGQLLAKSSFLYYLINGYIVMRYGFGRCPCNPEAMRANAESEHKLPDVINALASQWLERRMAETSGSGPGLGSGLAEGSLPSGNNATKNHFFSNIVTLFRKANSFGHKLDSCDQVKSFSLLGLKLDDSDLYTCFYALIALVLVLRLAAYVTIYARVRLSL